MYQIQQTFATNQATMAQLISIWSLKLEEDEAQDVDEPQPLTKIENFRPTLEDIDDYLSHKRGSYGVALAYVT